MTLRVTLLVIVFCLVCDVAAYLYTDPGRCRQFFANFQPNIGELIEYRFFLDQAIEGICLTCHYECMPVEMLFTL